MDIDDSDRINSINKMLLEMATGNFFYRIGRSAVNDEVEALSITLNMLAEEMEEALIHQGFTNLDRKLLQIVQMSFIIDRKGLVQKINRGAGRVLNRNYDSIINQPFTNLLLDQSISLWQGTWSLITAKKVFDTKLDLIFSVSNSLELPKTAYISQLETRDSIDDLVLVTIIHHSKVDKELDRELMERISSGDDNSKYKKSNGSEKKKIRLTYDDIRKIRYGHDYILGNLENDFPRLKEFALKIGTNEFKLKYGFKELYGTTVHRFILKERLRNAKMLIQYTDHPLKSIAMMTGFKSFPHFSRTFKKHFGYNPNSLRKK